MAHHDAPARQPGHPAAPAASSTSQQPHPIATPSGNKGVIAFLQSVAFLIRMTGCEKDTEQAALREIEECIADAEELRDALANAMFEARVLRDGKTAFVLTQSKVSRINAATTRCFPYPTAPLAQAGAA